MRRAIIAAIVLMILAPLWAQEAEVVYLEGEPERRTGSGTLDWLDFGTQVFPGEQVITGRSDYVELEQGAAAVVRVDPDTVFTIREVEEDGRRRTVMSTSIGQVRFRFDRLAGREEPLVGTHSTVAGIRGTELVVVAGADGSSLFIVDAGEVEVRSAGETVSLGAAQGVEVRPGAPPGEPFAVIGRATDYSEWAEERRAAIAADPVGAAERVRLQIDALAVDADRWYTAFLEARAESDAARATLRDIADNDEQARYREEVWLPLAQRTATAVLNYRYYALSALSLRRHALSAIYLDVRTRSIMEPVAQYERFMQTYRSIVSEFEASVGPYLEDTDL